jgi:hypothetical protein
MKSGRTLLVGTDVRISTSCQPAHFDEAAGISEHFSDFGCAPG